MSIGRKGYFIVVAETGNITKAAQLLHVSQPSLSQYLTRLEKDLGVKLLQRNCTPLRLTKAGEMYLAYVRELLEVEERFEKKLTEMKQQKTDTLTLGIPSQLIPFVFDRAIQRFVLEHPSVRLSIKEGTSLSAADMLIRDEVEVAIVHSLHKSDARFNRLVLLREELLLVCSKDHPLVAGRESSYENPVLLTEADFPVLEQMRFVHLSKEYYLYYVMKEYCERAGIHPKKMLELPSLPATISFMQHPESEAVTVLSNFAVSDGASNIKELAFMRVKDREMFWYLTMNAPAEAQLSSAGKLLWDFVRENMGDSWT